MTAAGQNGGTMPAVGAHVMTADRQELGTVKEVRGHAFKVDAPMRQDYWLGDSAVTTLAGDRVTLNFPKDQLDQYRLSGPDDLNGGPTNAIDLLMQMHREAKQQFTQILGAADGQQAARIWAQLQPVLKVHEEMEEKYLYDPLKAQQGSGSELGNWEPEHEREVDHVEELIARTKGMEAGAAAWRDQIRTISDTLAEHIAEEEGTIFPRIRQVWDENRLQQAGRQMQQMKQQKLSGVSS